MTDTSKWVVVKLWDDKHTSLLCEKCNVGGLVRIKTKYCPNCGRLMVNYERTEIHR